jgi:TatD DNase family protein
MKNNDLKILIHCFTGSKTFAHKLIDLGCYISASGVVTFKKSKDLADTFVSLPNDRILVETDSPYLSPEPLRGKPNEPSHIIHTVNFLARLKKVESSFFANQTTLNFFKLFGQLK